MQPPFSFDRANTERSIRNSDGALWPVNAYSDADELDSLLQAALDTGLIARSEPRARLYIYPLSLAEPEPLLAVDPGAGPTLLGHSLKPVDREGQDPVAFTLRLLEELVDEANGLAVAADAGSRAAAQEAEAEMTLLCPHCCSEEIAPIDGETRRECRNCGATIAREQALVTVADAEAHAEHGASCACSDVRGCPQCVARAERLVGALVRDDYGREWQVTEADEKDGSPTVCGERFWARLEDVEVLHEAG